MNYYKNAALNFGTKLRFSKTFLSVLVVGLLAPLACWRLLRPVEANNVTQSGSAPYVVTFNNDSATGPSGTTVTFTGNDSSSVLTLGEQGGALTYSSYAKGDQTNFKSLSGAQRALDAVSPSQINKVIINGGSGDNTLIINNPASSLFAPNAEIEYHGGSGYDTLVLQGGGGSDFHVTYTPGPTRDAGLIETTNGQVRQVINFTGLEPVQDNVPAATAVVNGNVGNNAINYVKGPGGGIFVGNTGLVTVDNMESFEFNNKTNLVINGLAGDDTINLNYQNTANPAGLTGTITVNGGDPSASDTLILNGIAGVLDNLRYLPTNVGAGTVINDNEPQPNVNFTGIEHLTEVVQQADGDGVRQDGTTGNDAIEFFHGVTSDSGSFVGTMDQNNATGVGPFTMTPMNFTGAFPQANDTDVNFFGAGGTDSFVFNGTGNDDNIVVTGGEAGGTNFRNTLNGILVANPEVFNVTTGLVRGLEGNDNVTINSPAGPSAVALRVEGGNSDASTDTVNYNSPSGAATGINYGTSTITSAAPAGNSVTFSGVEVINETSSGAGSTLTVTGTAGADNLAYSPSAATAGTVTANGHPTINFTGVGNTFTIDPAGGSDSVSANGSAGNDTINAFRSGANTNVQVSLQKTVILPTANTEALQLFGGPGDDQLNVNVGAAIGSDVIGIPITFDGGAGTEIVDVFGAPPTAVDEVISSPGLSAGENRLRYENAANVTLMTVNSYNVEGVIDLIPAAIFTVNGTDAGNAINYSAVQIIGAGGRVSIDNFAPLEFANKTNLTINGLAGSDLINLNKAITPPGLTGVTVNGGDPTADSDKLIVDGTGGNDTIGYNPSSTLGSGSVTVNALPAVTFLTTESLVIDGQGGTDALTLTTPAGVDQLTYTPSGTAADTGAIAVRQAGVGTALVPLSFSHLGAAGSITLASSGGVREDVLELYGTDDSDIFNVNTTPDAIQIVNPTGGFVTDRLNTGGINLLQLRGLNGDDTFNLAAVLPYGSTLVDAGDPSASDTLNLTGATGAISRNAAGQITGYGGTVTLLGLERVSLAGSGGAATLAIDGTAGDDTISFSPTAANAGGFAVGGTNFSYSAIGGAFTVNGGTGFDTLAVQGTSSDDIVTSTATTVTLNGGTMTLGSGLEQLSFTTSDGNDNITLTGLTLPITVDAGAGNDSVSGTGVTAAMRIFGGDGNDSIVGGSANDLIYGGFGNDIMAGGGGNDQVFGDEGDDRFGEPAVRDAAANDPGNDQFFGGGGSDEFFWDPGDGDDLVEGGAGDSDQIQFFGNAGAEQFFVFADLNVQSRLHVFRVQAAIDIDASDIEQVNVTANGGVDTVTIGRSDTGALSDLSTTGVRLVNLLLGDDGSADSIVFEGRPANDNILVSLPVAGNFDLVKLAGLNYDLTLSGLDSPVSDRLTINGNEGNDEIKAVDGVETGVNITLNGGAGDDVLSADATLSGGDGNDTLKGGNGNDTMDGGNGDDVLVFTAGNDTMTGGAGVDTLRAEGNDAANTINLSQAGTVVTISTGLASGTVDFTGALSMERIDVFAFGGNDNITVSGVTLPKTIDAGAGNDTVDLSAAADATIIGGPGDDSLTGSPAADNIDGGPGIDTLSGLGGNDVLSGGDGNDTLTGGTGADQMFGGPDSDTLIWNNGDGSDLMEGGGGTDAVQVNGSNGSGDAFLVTAAGARVSFARTNLGPFSLDIGATEELTVNGLDGDDAFNVTPLALTHITINGGNPTPPAAPGDQLNVDFTGSTNSIKTPTGVGSGIWSFNNRQSINFNGIETQGPAGPSITINNVTVPEGNAGSSSATFTATLSAPSAQIVSVDVSTANGTATAPVDYQSGNGTLTFLPGVTTANFNVPINGDTTPEGNETFFVNLTNAVNANITTALGTGTINDDDSTNIFQFSSATATVAENAVPGSATVTVTRTGDLTGAASVKFETSEGTAKQKTDYTFGYGTVRFAPGEASKDVKILIVNDVFIEGPETFQVTLSNPSGNCAVGSPGTITVTINDDDVGAAPNPIDETTFFVRQHYLDFLGREPDAGGLAFWTGQITACGVNPACIAAKRVDVSASFFLSLEFQETGGFALRVQRASFGRQSNDPFARYPYLQFMRDSRTIGEGVIVGQPGFDTLLEQNKQAYAEQIVASTDFGIRFPAAPAADYVDALFASAGVTPTAAEQTAAINAFGAGGTIGRVAALRSVTDSASVRAADARVAFVLAEYYGYLRRNPTDAPDFNDAGYQFWLNKLNAFNGNYIDAEMVKAFITSLEYRGRFAP